ncbi:PTS mannose/fructose/sorbose transporter subunit IIC [Listeria booriae]|uniref:PTS mannose/fructose/sorbose transporter subunit IIC n=1 Tax=Listeria booriae TaxID=1552123 RepID=A0A7X1CZH8_9LIST|nr:PTS mannose/fructose/sorbose transporter subunit IIC [Listeria booriae]MBC1778059.1 PTS mannose/fructose/sorbose transporter subunit IIC [Listeria booriae]MBC1795422.1 PTS mannose/fructose/sorbose transporter subunit IIC [Listeria booriae]MBC1799057.1 PTS mannose/fructose/sorbose transporter subunit IIC [Listeria booriae]MBC1802200.1 PTS mannose/fructose/sorbose transporter subunit IIC [Listeria booriae]MBC1887042.1 PTS mannose/fructose/sorbose transporter subunit IIC [Listeria booriae]
MDLSIIQIILVFIASCLIGAGSVLDEFQTHRPLIACTLIGLILGDVTTGIILGGTLELVAIGWMNIGAAQSPDPALASTIATILVIIGSRDISEGIAIALPVAAAGQVLTVLCRTMTVFFQHAAEKEAKKANFGNIIRLHFGSLMIQALRVAIPTTIVAYFVNADMVTRFLDMIPDVITGGLTVAGGFIVVVGYAMVLNMMSVKYLMPFFFLGFLLGGYLNFSLLAYGAIGVILAILYLNLDPKYNKSNANVAATDLTTLAENELED